jgi:hypothetical protein
MTTYKITIPTQWVTANDNEKTNAKVYHGDRPCLPAQVMLALAERIWRRRK